MDGQMYMHLHTLKWISLVCCRQNRLGNNGVSTRKDVRQVSEVVGKLKCEIWGLMVVNETREAQRQRWAAESASGYG